MQDTKKVGSVGIKAILYFEVVTTLALIIGLLVINLMKPGVGMNIDPATLDPQAVADYVTKSNTTSTVEFLLHIIPENIINALSTGNLLQVLFFAVLFGIALSKIGAKALPAIQLIKSVETGLFAVINIIMKVAPLGALGAMSFTIGKFGLGSLASLGQLMISFYITCILFIVIVLGGILRYFGFNISDCLGLLKEILIVLNILF
jgi:aerobic C4-dicarboxylate transport protein